MSAQPQAAGTLGGASSGRARHAGRRPIGACTALPQTSRLVFMFTDIEGSAAMHERLGDLECLRVLRSHNRVVRQQVALHGGVVVKSQGDGFMVAFRDADAALRCAVAIQRELASGGLPLRVRIGLHAGQALREGNDYFGRDVIIASRVTAQACGGEIVASASVKDEISSARFDDGRRVNLKGFEEPVRVHRAVYAE